MSNATINTNRERPTADASVFYKALLATAFSAVAFAQPSTTITTNTFEVLPYDAPAYKYLRISVDPGNGFMQFGFADSVFAKGRAPFGNSKTCFLPDPAQTAWPPDSKMLLVRRFVTIPEGATNVRILLTLSGGVEAFLNAKQISPALQFEHVGCPTADNIRLDVPQQWVQSGPNILAFKVYARGVQTFFDSRVLADIPAARLAESNEATLAMVPVSDITVHCSSIPGTVSRPAATVSFVMPATRETGTIKIVNSGASITADYSLNGQLMMSTSHTAGADASSPTQAMSTRVSSRRLHNLVGLLALAEVQGRRQVSTPVGGCLVPPRGILATCEDECHATGVAKRAICWGGWGQAGQVPFLGGVAGAAASLCSDDVTDQELDCKAGCNKPVAPICDPTTTCCEDAPICE